MLSKFDNFIVHFDERFLKIARWVSYINSCIAGILLIYRYGFFLSVEEVNDIFFRFDIIFFLYLLVFAVRIGFSLDRKAFAKGVWIESGMNAIMVVHGLFNYLFDYKIVLEVLHFLEFNNADLTYQHIISFWLTILIGFVITQVSTKISDLQIKPATTFIMSFVILILSGTGLLMLPSMTTMNGSMPFVDALFTSASASCVTGLIVVDTGTYFTPKGQFVILLLIQLGGLGIVSFATFFATFLAKGVGLKHQAIIQDFLSSESLSDAKNLMRQIIFITFFIEFLGAVCIFFSWDNDLGEPTKFASLGDKIYSSIFHSISAFCNAGFSLFTDGLYNNDSDKQIRQMYLLHFVIGIIIVFGGLGFSTIEDAFSIKRIKERIKSPWKRWKIGTTVAIYSSLVLIVVGTVGIMILEYHQLTDRTIIEAFITALFQSIVTRTAGFNTMDFGTLRDATIILVIFLMFIGAAPGSTGGGLKVNTFVLVALSAFASIRGQKNITIARRNIPSDLITKSFSIFMFSITYNIIAVFLLSLTDSDKSVLQLLFEQVSAYATVGLSMGITAKLSFMGKIIITISMFVGRVGTLTLALALSNSVQTNSYRYPDEHLMVG
ncbi:MAG: Trk-type K+ transporter membrane component [Bacteroidetes bacterium]|nr:MAG: Trk-type K+ transporter membrane component [Bacteroidota bacterium]